MNVGRLHVRFNCFTVEFSHFKENDAFVKAQGGVPPQDLAGENGVSFPGSFQLRDFHGFNRRISKDHQHINSPITKTKKNLP